MDYAYQAVTIYLEQRWLGASSETVCWQVKIAAKWLLTTYIYSKLHVIQANLVVVCVVLLVVCVALAVGSGGDSRKLSHEKSDYCWTDNQTQTP